MMTCFHERDGVLHADDVPLSRIAAEHGTPAYIYSASSIRDQVKALQAAFKSALPALRQPMIVFACKANSNLSVLRQMGALGVGADIVSGGELQRALAAGIDPSRIVYSGVGKSAADIKSALDAGILQFNVESAPELERIGRIAGERGVCARVALRFNPDVDAGTHAKITTGKGDNKFGLPRADIVRLYDYAANAPSLDIVGLSMHIGSQLTEAEPYREAFEKLAALAGDLRQGGFTVTRLDLGGGVGVVYKDEKTLPLDVYAGLVRDIILPLDTEIIVEPGRLLVAEAGVLLARVEYIKDAGGRRYVILDAGMNDLMRPALYEAWHDVRPVQPRQGAAQPVDIVGPVCETGDTFALNRPMPPLEEGDLVALMTAGAYGFTMASTYNTLPLPPEIMVDGDTVALIRARQSVQDIIAPEAFPDSRID